jgi:peptidoglycan DL-endopeptidase CwlO
LSQKRARLRALASLGLSIVLFGALVPATSAASIEASAPSAASAANNPATSSPTAISAATVLAGTADAISLSSQDRPPTPSATAAAPVPAAPVKATVAVAATVAASTRVIALAETHLGARYQYGATGPRTFDCSGLVYRVFEDAALGRKIDSLQSAAAMYAHFRALHMVSTRNPQPGDLVIFGGGSHVGIYIGAGRVVHAMVTGVAITRISAVYPKFTTYVHLGLTKLRLPARTAITVVHHVTAPKVITTVRTIVPLSFRAAPSTAARRFLVLRPGVRLAVIAISRGPHHVRWFRVIAPGGRIGWVVAAYAR